MMPQDFPPRTPMPSPVEPMNRDERRIRKAFFIVMFIAGAALGCFVSPEWLFGVVR